MFAESNEYFHYTHVRDPDKLGTDPMAVDGIHGHLGGKREESRE